MLSERFEAYHLKLLRSLSKKLRRAPPAPEVALSDFNRERANIEAAIRSAQIFQRVGSLCALALAAREPLALCVHSSSRVLLYEQCLQLCGVAQTSCADADSRRDGELVEASLLCEMADACVAARTFSAAKLGFRRAISIRTKHLGAQTQPTASALFGLGRALHGEALHGIADLDALHEGEVGRSCGTQATSKSDKDERDWSTYMRTIKLQEAEAQYRAAKRLHELLMVDGFDGNLLEPCRPRLSHNYIGHNYIGKLLERCRPRLSDWVESLPEPERRPDDLCTDAVTSASTARPASFVWAGWGGDAKTGERDVQERRRSKLHSWLNRTSQPATQHATQPHNGTVDAAVQRARSVWAECLVADEQGGQSLHRDSADESTVSKADRLWRLRLSYVAVVHRLSTLLCDIGGLESKQGDGDTAARSLWLEAAKLADGAVRMHRLLLGPQDAKLAPILANAAQLEHNLQRHDQAALHARSAARVHCGALWQPLEAMVSAQATSTAPPSPVLGHKPLSTEAALPSAEMAGLSSVRIIEMLEAMMP